MDSTQLIHKLKRSIWKTFYMDIEFSNQANILASCSFLWGPIWPNWWRIVWTRRRNKWNLTFQVECNPNTPGTWAPEEGIELQLRAPNCRIIRNLLNTKKNSALQQKRSLKIRRGENTHLCIRSHLGFLMWACRIFVHLLVFSTNEAMVVWHAQKLPKRNGFWFGISTSLNLV